MTERAADGKRALFSVPTGDDATPITGHAGDSSGKRALYSAAGRRLGTLVVECERCRGRVRVDYVEFARLHFPVWVWAPWRRHSRWMRCPACGHQAWLAPRWLA